MDWNRIEGNWKQTKGKVKEKWGQLTDDDLTAVSGKARTAGRQDPGALRLGQGPGAQGRRRLAQDDELSGTSAPQAQRGTGRRAVLCFCPHPARIHCLPAGDREKVQRGRRFLQREHPIRRSQ